MEKRALSKTEISPFTADREQHASHRAPQKRKAHKGNKRGRVQKHDPHFDARSMMVKFGICAAACAAVLLIKEAKIPAAQSALSSIRETLSEEENIDDMLGKLQFVELPGMIQVFSDSGKILPPIVFDKYELTDDDRLLSLTAKQDCAVKATIRGTVKETGIDAERGNYVRIRSENDTELFLYGLSQISVEAGQPLQASDDVGVVSAMSPLYVAITVSGRPQEPLNYFSISAETV
ncbi:MAG: hypothetical protein IJN00_07810 [Clostridia bacterium]|nr:hypothetical protein [Clostridia bacterium]